MSLNTRVRRILSLVVTVAMMLPVISSVAEAAVANWLAPPPGQRVTGRNVEVAIGFNTYSDVKVTRLELWVDGRFNSKKYLVRPDTRGVCSFTWDASKYADGAHNLLVKLYSDNTLVATVSSTGTVGDTRYDTRPPVVVFTNIKSGDVLKGKTTIRLKATDESGENPLVSLLVDDALKLVKNTPPYDYDLDTTTYADGGHEVETYAYDGAGNKSAPAVVKVVFKNGFKLPVAASISVVPVRSTPVEDELPADYKDKTPEPPVVRATPTPAAKIGAARVAEPQVVALVAGGVAAPVVRSMKPQPNVASTSVFTAAPPTSSAVLAKSSTATVWPEIDARTDNAKPVYKMASARPAEPRAELAPASAFVPSTQWMDVAGVPVGRSTLGSAQPLNIASEPRAIGTPVVSEVRDNEAASAAGVLQSSRDVQVVSGHVCAPPPAVEEAAVSEAKPVRVAMAPDIRTDERPGSPVCSITRPPQVIKDTKAKIEKVVLPVSGKMKIRDLFGKLGGIVFWDSDTRTVIAYARELKLELQIGSNVAIVNGRKMRIEIAPQIIDGRTVIDAGVYHRAFAMARASTN